MLTGIHILLSYTCTMECDHCFLHSKPNAGGTFTLAQIREVLDEAGRVGTVRTIYFEGGEPFMFYPLMLEGIRLAREKGFEVGIVTNSYFATTVEDAELWLVPIKLLGVSMISISEDEFHFGKEDTRTANAIEAADRLGIPRGTISIERPAQSKEGGSEFSEEGAVVGGGPQLKGRAAEKIAPDLPTRPVEEFKECRDEELRAPKRVHVDAHGLVHICQGIIMGNMWETPLAKMIEGYDPGSHPIVGPLLEGGPARLAEMYGIGQGERFASACHCCYMVRKALVERFPEQLGPRLVYGLE